MELKVKVDGMSCQMCVQRLEKGLRELETVSSAAADLKAGEVTVAGESLDKEAVLQRIEELGFDPL